MPAKSNKNQRVFAKQRAFLMAFRISGSVTEAAASLKIDRALHYRWLREDDAYALRFMSASKEAAENYQKRSVEEAEWLHTTRKARLVLEMHRNHEDRIAKLEAELRRLKAALKR